MSNLFFLNKMFLDDNDESLSISYRAYLMIWYENCDSLVYFTFIFFSFWIS